MQSTQAVIPISRDRADHVHAHEGQQVSMASKIVLGVRGEPHKLANIIRTNLLLPM